MSCVTPMTLQKNGVHNDHIAMYTCWKPCHCQCFWGSIISHLEDVFIQRDLEQEIKQQQCVRGMDDYHYFSKQSPHTHTHCLIIEHFQRIVDLWLIWGDEREAAGSTQSSAFNKNIQLAHCVVFLDEDVQAKELKQTQVLGGWNVMGSAAGQPSPVVALTSAHCYSTSGTCGNAIHPLTVCKTTLCLWRPVACWQWDVVGLQPVARKMWKWQ